MSIEKKRISSVVIGLIVACAMIISSCDAVTGVSGDPAPLAALTALSASRAKVGQPIPITSVSNLADIGVDPAYPADGDYVLGANLTLTDWVSICDTSVGQDPFTGTFDGDGHTITVDSFDPTAAQGTASLGIFADTDQNTTTYLPATFSNLTVNIAAEVIKYRNHNLGVLVGNATNAAFNDVTVTGALNAELAFVNQNAGGIAGKAVNAQFNNVIVTADFNVNSSAGTVSTVNIGGVAGIAQSSTFSDVNVKGKFDDTFMSPAPSQNGKLVLVEDGYLFQGVTTPGSDGLNVGGVVGHVEASQFSATGQAAPSQFTAIVANVTINATNRSGPVYVGGVAAYANGATIENAQVSGSINGSGPGYNTSAGGVAAYIINSRVLNSSAAVDVTLSGLSQTFGYSDSWQIYSGGLAGYVGGSDYGASLIDHSYATGSVSATSPFPYAGGLVGYLYGYNDFTNPAKNGSTVSRSYATGNVTATSQDDPSGVDGDIPYAGGLVGYSSVKGSTIVDSYATGSATVTTKGTYAWAGGVVGGNANNAVVLRTYATGDVNSTAGTLPPIFPPDQANDPGPAAGGIAGFNYYSANTSVSNSVALNSSISGNQSTTQDVVHRVVGGLGKVSGYIGTLDNNYANEQVAIGSNWKSHIGPNFEDGASIIPPPPQSLYDGMGWDFSKVWQLTGAYPTLR
jgi:hypothetical protein